MKITQHCPSGFEKHAAVLVVRACSSTASPWMFAVPHFPRGVIIQRRGVSPENKWPRDTVKRLVLLYGMCCHCSRSRAPTTLTHRLVRHSAAFRQHSRRVTVLTPLEEIKTIININV